MMINPLLEREVKTRMRTWKTPILILVYLGIIGMVVAFAFFVEYSSSSYGSPGFNPAIVTTIYIVISMFQLGLLMFILPILTATSISGERERQTLDLMLCTDFSPWNIILGKMSSALAFVFLLILAALPFTGIILLFGGVGLLDIVKIVLFYMATAIMVSSVGMFTSTHFKKNISSIVMSYVICGGLLSLPAFGLIAFEIIANINSSSNSGSMTFMQEHIQEIMLFIFASNPFYGAMDILTQGSSNNVFYIFGFGGGNTSGLLSIVQPWMANVLFFALVSVVALVLSKGRLTKLK